MVEATKEMVIAAYPTDPKIIEGFRAEVINRVVQMMGLPPCNSIVEC